MVVSPIAVAQEEGFVADVAQFFGADLGGVVGFGRGDGVGAAFSAEAVVGNGRF